MDVVKADDGHVLGDAEAALVEGAKGADGGEVVGAEDGGRRMRCVEKLGHAEHAAFQLVIALDDEALLRGAAGGVHGGEEGDAAEAGGVLGEGAADEANVAVAEGDEMLDGLLHAVEVIDHKGVGTKRASRGFPWGEDFLRDVDEDHGDVAAGELFEDGIFDAEGHDGDAIDVALDHAAQAVLELGVVVGGTNEELVAVADGGGLEALDEFGEEGVGDVRDEEAEEARAAGDEGAGLGVGVVVEIAYGLADAGGHGGVDGGDVVDGAGGGGDGDVGGAGRRRGYRSGVGRWDRRTSACESCGVGLFLEKYRFAGREVNYRSTEEA